EPSSLAIPSYRLQNSDTSARRSNEACTRARHFHSEIAHVIIATRLEGVQILASRAKSAALGASSSSVDAAATRMGDGFRGRSAEAIIAAGSSLPYSAAG